MSWREDDNPVAAAPREPGPVGPILDLAARMQLGLLTLEDYQDKLDKAQGRFTRLYLRMAHSVLAGKDLEPYREGLMESLVDTFALLQSGLDKLLSYSVGKDRTQDCRSSSPRKVRMGLFRFGGL
ncbi:hypothetical protein IV102_24830 [bacterium]|nr:hypothetical protein [bacterium]